MPAPDAAQALAQATAVCHGISTITAEASVAGSAGGRRISRGRLLLGLAAPASARIEAPAPFGAPVFIFVAVGDDATLLLERDDRVLEHGRPDEVLEALTGVPLDAAALKTTLTGCLPAALGGGAAAGVRFGDEWRVVREGSTAAYLRRRSDEAPWQLVSVVHDAASSAEWRAEYRDFLNGLPRAVRLSSARSRRFDLRIDLADVEINVPLEAEVFRVRLPVSVDPITLDELRRAGPLGDLRSNAP
jgi:hypothetical protein